MSLFCHGKLLDVSLEILETITKEKEHHKGKRMRK